LNRINDDFYWKAVIFKNNYHQKGTSRQKGSLSLDRDVVTQLTGKAAFGQQYISRMKWGNHFDVDDNKTYRNNCRKCPFFERDLLNFDQDILISLSVSR